MPKEPSHILKLTVRLDGADAAKLIGKADATSRTPTSVAHDLLHASLAHEHQQAAEPKSAPAATPISTEAERPSYAPRNARLMQLTIGLALLLGVDGVFQYRNMVTTQKALADLRAQTKADLQAFRIETAKYVAPRLRDHQTDLDAIFKRLENAERVIYTRVLNRELASKTLPDRK